jgi:hypothetical protein
MHRKEERNMKNFKTKLLALILVFATAFGSVPLTAQAAVDAPSEETYYLTSDEAYYTSFYIGGLSKSSKVTNVKSSNESVVTLNYYQKSSSASSNTTKYFNSDEEDSTNSYKDYSAYIGIILNKEGSSNITYTIGKKKYTTKITVKKYTNPLKTVEISGLKNGKKSNLSGLVDKSSSASGLTLKSDQKNATIKVAVKKGWKINYVELYDEVEVTALQLYNYAAGLSSVTLHPGTLKKDGAYSFYVGMYNEENGGYFYISYAINY